MFASLYQLTKQNTMLASLHELAKQNTLQTSHYFCEIAKSQHKYIVLNLGWIFPPIINKDISELKKWKLPSNSTYSN